MAVTRHKWAPSRFFFEMYCPDRSSRAKSRIAAGPQSVNRVNFCDCRHEIIGKTAVLLSPVKGGRKNSRYGPSPPPPLLPSPSFPFFPGRLGSSAASRRFWAELGAPAAPRLLIFGEPKLSSQICQDLPLSIPLVKWSDFCQDRGSDLPRFASFDAFGEME